MKLYMRGFDIGYRIREITGLSHSLEKFVYVGVAATLLIIMMAGLPQNAIAQTGTISGKVIDANTGEPLSQVNVSLETAGKSVITDRDGRFVIRGVPSGTNTVSVNYLGYSSVQSTVSVESGNRVNQTIELQGEDLEGDRVFVRNAQHSRSRVLNKEFQSINNSTAFTNEQMDQFTDYTIWGAAARHPGVQVGGRGEISIRGTGLDMYAVTINGQRMASTGLGTRGIDLDLIPSDLFKDMEVFRVITPDMDADAIGGVINLNTYNPVGGSRRVDIRVGGGANSQYFGFTGAGSRASISYSESLTEAVTMSANFHQQTLHRSVESIGIDFGVHDFGAGLVDVIERTSPSITNDTRNMISGNMQFSWQPNEYDNYYISGWVNNNDRNIRSNIDNYSANGDFVRPDSTGETGTYRHDALLNDYNLNQLMVRAGGRHLIDFVNLEYNVGWAQSKTYSDLYQFPLLLQDLNYIINMDDRLRPTMELTSQQFMLVDGSIDRRWPQMTDFQHIKNRHADNTFSGRVDAEIPVGPVSFKLGSSARLTNKVGEYDELSLRYFRDYRMLRFSKLKQRDYEVLNEEAYKMPWLVDTDNALIFFKSQRPLFVMDEDLYRERSDIWDYDVSENILAGYGMATLEFGSFSILGGARLEHTMAQYDGRKVVMAENSSFVSSTDDNTKDDYTYIFPNAQLAFSPSDLTNIRVAYSQSMRRHDFNRLAPFELVNRSDSTLFRGNMNLKPMISDNVDLFIDQYFRGYSVFSIGAFYKEMNNFVHLSHRSIDVREGDIAGFDPYFEDAEVTVVPVMESQFRNSDESAVIYGIELSWQQSLGFLPGFFGNFGTFANYTWSQSEFDTDRSDVVALPYHSPHVVNAALDYTQGRVFARVSYHWTDEHITSLGPGSIAPAISTTDEVYMDHYQDGWSDLSVTFRFRISEHFRFWGDFFNLIPDKEQLQYQHTRNLYPTSIDYRGGLGFRTGIRYTF